MFIPFKQRGNEQFKAQNFDKAIINYTYAIGETPDDHTIYGNRSTAYYKLKQYEQALADGEKCIQLKPDWSKGYQRKGNALHAMGKSAEALLVYKKGVEIDPSNDFLKKEIVNLEKENSANMGSMGGMPGGMGGMPGGMGGMPGGIFGMPGSMFGMGGMGRMHGGMGGMFGGGMGGGNPMPGMASMFDENKLKQNPKIAKFFDDPQFVMKFQMVKQNPQMIYQFIQQDMRFSEVIKEATGMDLMDKQEQKMEINPEKAEEYKQKGNQLFQQKNFQGAIKEYDEGLRHDPNVVAIYSNRCSAYIKLENMQQALKDAEKCIELDPKLVLAYFRKGYCHHQGKDYDKAMKAYEDGLKLDPDNAEIKQAQQMTMMALQMGGSSIADHNNQHAEQAMKDPEIQAIMMDPMVKTALEKISTDPNAAQEVMQDPSIAEKINKLMAVGIIKRA